MTGTARVTKPQITRRLGATVERHRGRTAWLSLPEAGLIAALMAYVGPLALFLIFSLVTARSPSDFGDVDALHSTLTIVNGLFAAFIVTRVVAVTRSRRSTKRAHIVLLLTALVVVALVQVLAHSVTNLVSVLSAG